MLRSFSLKVQLGVEATEAMSVLVYVPEWICIPEGGPVMPMSIVEPVILTTDAAELSLL